jgi:CubicO group peptidase (beta-lactamase class C family)
MHNPSSCRKLSGENPAGDKRDNSMTLRLGKKILRKQFRSISVPDDLDAITHIDDDREVPPAEAGLDRAVVDGIWENTQKLYRTGAHPLLSICLRRNGKIVLNRSIGYQQGDAVSPDAVVADLETPVCLFSASKAISAMLLHLLAEQGEIHLLDPISYYIPAFAANGKSFITIYQLLAHRAGVPGLGEDVDPSLLYEREEVVRRICASEPLDSHGRTAAYHALTGGFLIDELIRVTTGLTIQQYMDRYIRKPMDMRYFRFGVTRRDLPRVAEHRCTGLKPGKRMGGMLENVLGIELEQAIALSNSEEFRTAVLPSANIYCTAEEAGRFFQMLLNYGSYEGKQIMQPLTVHRAIQEAGKAQLDASLKMPMRYSAGFMLGGSPVGMYGPDTHYAYGHLGLSNVMCWADPARDISVAILNTGKPVLSNHIVALFRLMASISRGCPPTHDMAQKGAPFLAA